MARFILSTTLHDTDEVVESRDIVAMFIDDIPIDVLGLSIADIVSLKRHGAGMTICTHDHMHVILPA